MTTPQQTKRRDQRRRGSATIEFVLAGSFIFLPMLAGLSTVGMSIITARQLASFNSSAAQMLSSGTDFTQVANQNILLKLAGTLNTSTSGSGVIILSEIDGTSTGEVCTSQITIPLGTIGGTGTSVYAPGQTVSFAFTALMPTMAVGQVAYVAESYYNNPNFAWAFAPTGTPTGIYVKAIY